MGRWLREPQLNWEALNWVPVFWRRLAKRAHSLPLDGGIGYYFSQGPLHLSKRLLVMSATENELEQCLTQRRLMGSLQALWFSIFPRDWPEVWGEGQGELIASDNPDWVWRSNTPPAPPPQSWEGAWLPAVIQASDLGALPSG